MLRRIVIGCFFWHSLIRILIRVTAFLMEDEIVARVVQAAYGRPHLDLLVLHIECPSSTMRICETTHRLCEMLIRHPELQIAR